MTTFEHLNKSRILFCSENNERCIFQHAAAVIGRKMLVVGGDSDLGMLNDVQVLL